MSAETIARRIFDQAGISPLSEDGVAHVAAELFGERNLDFAQQTAFVSLAYDGAWHLLVRIDLCDEDLSIAIAYGVADWWLRTHPPESVPCELRALAEAIALPSVALRDAVTRLGPDIDAIACEFVLRPEIVERRMQSSPSLRKSGTRARIAS